MEREEIRPEVRAFHDECLVADMHADSWVWQGLFGYDIRKRHRIVFARNPFFNHIDIPRAREGGLNVTGQAVSAHPFRPATCVARGQKMMGRILKGIEHSGGELEKCVNAGEVREAVAGGRLAVFLSVEGAHIVGGRMDAVEWMHERGMRYLTLGHFSENEAVFSSNDRKNAGEGLKPFGRELVRKLEELGVMVDVAHVAPGCLRDVVKMARKPVFVSHIGMKAVKEHWRNLDDEQVRAVADTGGVMGIIFSPYFLSEHFWACGLNTVVRHFEHCMEVAGEDHVALGSDWDGCITVPVGLEDVTGLPLLTQRLLDRGHSRETVRKVLGENFMRVFGEVCG